MAKRVGKKKTTKSSKTTSKRRSERRFATSSTYMPSWVAAVGMVGCLLLGAGVFGLWILDAPLPYAPYLVAAGGVGLGIALWFGQPNETAVAVGDAGLAVEDGRQTARIAWYDLQSIHIAGGNVVAVGQEQTLTFLLGANRNAAAHLLKNASERVPDILDVDSSLAQSLPHPDDAPGYQQQIEDDQVTGIECAASEKLINMEEDARFCPQCGQLFHKEGLPAECPSCQASLKGRALRF